MPPFKLTAPRGLEAEQIHGAFAQKMSAESREDITHEDLDSDLDAEITLPETASRDPMNTTW
jgi:hypothetical protein